MAQKSLNGGFPRLIRSMFPRSSGMIVSAVMFGRMMHFNIDIV